MREATSAKGRLMAREDRDEAEARRLSAVADVPEPMRRMLAFAPAVTLNALTGIYHERIRQDEKWGADRSLHPSLWLTILVEEVGEVAEAILDEINRAAGASRPPGRAGAGCGRCHCPD